MMHKLLSSLFVTTALAAAVPAHALTLVSTASNGNSVTAGIDGSALPVITADIEFTGFGAVSLQFEVDSADVNGLAGFNAVISNLIGVDIAAIELTLSRGTFALVGSVTPQFSAVDSSAGDALHQRITFAPAEPFGIDLGNPFAAAGEQDWLFGFNGLEAGDRFELTVSAVPEPASWVLLLAGAGVLANMHRRRSRSRRQ